MNRLAAWWKYGRSPRYGRKPTMVLMNGLAEQAETWFRNVPAWRSLFDIHMPNILTFDGPALHSRIRNDEPISVDWLVEQLHTYLETFVQTPPYILGGSSTGGKVVTEYALRHPQNVSHLLLFGPSGLAEVERMPIIEGVRRGDPRSVVESVFYDIRATDPRLIPFYKTKFSSRAWKLGLIRAIRGTLEHSIRDRLPQVVQPTLMLVGAEDRIVDPKIAQMVGRQLKRGELVLLKRCGHAPHLEKPRFVNRKVLSFLRQHPTTPVKASTMEAEAVT